MTITRHRIRRREQTPAADQGDPMIAACSKCTHLWETSEEEANEPGLLCVNCHYGRFIHIAADHVRRLRKCDVYRVLDSAPPSQRHGLAHWLARQRPDLANEVAVCAKDIEEGA